MRLILVAAVLLAGCTSPTVGPEERPDGIWMTHTAGCGFCGGSTGPWAGTLVVYGHEDPMWFSFRPDTGQGDPVEGVEMPAAHEAKQARVEEALAWIHESGSYHAKWDAFEVYDVRTHAWGDGRAAFEARIANDLDGLAKPPVFDNRCEDAGFPHVSVWRPHGVLAGDVPGAKDGCADEGQGPASWRSLSSDLWALHQAVRPA